MLRRWYHPIKVVFSHDGSTDDRNKILQLIRERAGQYNHLMGSTMMVVGMPNVGKSTLLNALRRFGMQKGKAAQTGGQPGVTRKIGTSVKIVEGSDGSEGVYLLDTPGVFVPYVPDGEAMLKLALCGSVKDSIINDITLADYLLYQLNRRNPSLYDKYHPPSNDVIEVLAGVANRTGRLNKGGGPNLEGAAQWFIQQWRKGRLGRFVLDEVTEDSLRRNVEYMQDLSPSISQARKSFKSARKAKAQARWSGGDAELGDST